MVTVETASARTELMYLLSQAAELEHSLACVYLYAAASLKSAPDEGLGDQELKTVQGWKHHIMSVAVDEMAHLAQVTNLATAIGASPHFARLNFPQLASSFPLNLTLSLEPFTLGLAERFVCYELPEDGILGDEDRLTYNILKNKVQRADPMDDSWMDPAARLLPHMLSCKTVGEFYRAIEGRIMTMNPRDLFIGDPASQANPSFLDLGGDLVVVTNIATAKQGIDNIIAQGEAPPVIKPDTHFFVFDAIRKEYGALLKLNPSFTPFRPSAHNPVTLGQTLPLGATLITNPQTEQVAELFNLSYDTLLLMLMRLFAHTEETDDELKHLARSALTMMSRVIGPLNEGLTKMPGDLLGTFTVGPTFGFSRDIEYLPHKTPAWKIINEHLQELVSSAASLVQASPQSDLQAATAGLQQVATGFMP